MSYFTGMNNMLFDGHPPHHYDEELAKILERENREKEELAARLECLEREAKQIHLQNLTRQINEVQPIKNDLLQHADAAEQFISNSHKNFPYLTLFSFNQLISDFHITILNFVYIRIFLLILYLIFICIGHKRDDNSHQGLEHTCDLNASKHMYYDMSNVYIIMFIHIIIYLV